MAAPLLHEALQLQLDEFACVRSMFPSERELVYDASLEDQYACYLERLATVSDPPVPPSPFTYAIRFLSCSADGNHVPELQITYPPAYPLASPVSFTVVGCASLTRHEREQLETALQTIAHGSHDSELVVLPLYQCMADALHEAAAQRDARPPTEKDDTTTIETTPPTLRLLGRRAIYFHHIIAPTKRRVIQEWARELRLGGLSKIGWPGVVIVEGDEQDAQEFVRRLQHLRWKQMAVRGEQTEPVVINGSGNRDDALNAQRRLPLAFSELPETAMAQAAALCREAGLEELFLSVMKIYRSSSSDPAREEDQDQLVTARGADVLRKKSSTARRAGVTKQ